MLDKNQMHNKIIKVDFLGDLSIAEWEMDIAKAMDIANRINNCLGEVDYRIANFESPVVFTEDTEPIDKSGPNLKTDKKYIPFLEELNIDGYTLANNHFGDYGVQGIMDTIHMLERLKRDYVGMAVDERQLYRPLRKRVKEKNFSIFSICESEFGTVYGNQVGAAGYNREMIRKSVEEETAWADYIIIVFHGGTEYDPFPSPEQKRRYRELIDFGADAVIGMHTHCPQGYERYRDKIIVYSTGNFFFPGACETPFKTWKTGYIARLHFDQEEIGFEIIPYKFDIYGNAFSQIDKLSFTEYLDKISEAIQDERKLENLYKAWACMSGRMYFERMCENIQETGNRKNLAMVKNMFSCEAHNELMKTYLNLLYYNETENYMEYAEEIKHYMDFPDGNMTGHKVLLENIDAVIWGIGKKAELLYRKIKKEDKKVVFVDKNPIKQGLFFMGEFIISPEEVMNCSQKTEIYLCMADKAAIELSQYLVSQNRTNIFRTFEV